MTPSTPLVIFTDLDGTLLDHQTYAFNAATEALKAVKDSHTPLIFCSSKTRAEIELWRIELGNVHPFIAENGGGIFFPPPAPFPKAAKKKNGYFVVELGIPYGKLIAHFRELKKMFGDSIRGFSEMDAAEVGERTGLAEKDARCAREREFTEPFVFVGDEADMLRLEQAAKNFNLRLTRGGRFYHLIADNDKGKAVCITADAYRMERPEVVTVALGDSANDAPMLKVVDIPILVQKPGGIYDPVAAALPEIRKVPGVGPAGWNHAVLEVLEEMKRER